MKANVWALTISSLILVCNDFPTHFAVGDVVCGELDRHTARGTWSAAQSLGRGDGPKSRGALLVGLCHVQVCHSHPAPTSPTALPLHVTILLGDISHLIPYPVKATSTVW